MKRPYAAEGLENNKDATFQVSYTYERKYI